MAEVTDKLPDNIGGKYYVDGQCIDCDVCRDTSTANFARNDENGYSFVYKQPETPDEFELCDEALNACPVGAIGDNGAEKYFTRP
ncbi:MAG: ferredoxin [Acidobacteria bacterium]|nr:ferredoxin [Acidobacteriota bacterium]MCA1607936.1 ferredoxin [Acidobacteriota bacterium]